MQQLRTIVDEIRAFEHLVKRLRPVPKEWIEQASTVKVQCTRCSDYKTLLNQWRKAMRWTDGLDHALVTMLATVASTKMIGDQLWIKVIGPASCGKSTLCEALTTNSRYVLAKSTFRGFHSGFSPGDSGGKRQDVSLVNQLRNKTFITKDGDTLLQAPNLPQILSEGRDLYDSVSRTHYRNSVANDYEGIRMTWILAGTSSLRQIDSSELGERFLDCVIMEDIDEELEREVLWRVANRSERNIATEANGKPESQNDPALVTAMGLTGGYVAYLRENVARRMREIAIPEDSKRMIVDLGLLVAYMRARPSKRQDETAEREFAARLVSQHIRLSMCIAFVLNKDTVDEDVMVRVRRVALDTARGRTLKIASTIYEENSLSAKAIGIMTGLGHMECRHLLRFLEHIKVVERFREDDSEQWRLTRSLRGLYSRILK